MGLPRSNLTLDNSCMPDHRLHHLSSKPSTWSYHYYGAPISSLGDYSHKSSIEIPLHHQQDIQNRGSICFTSLMPSLLLLSASMEMEYQTSKRDPMNTMDLKVR